MRKPSPPPSVSPPIPVLPTVPPVVARPWADGLGVEVRPGATRIGSRGLPRHIDADTPHQREVDEDASVARAVTGYVVAAATHRDRKIMRPGVRHSGLDVRCPAAPRDQRRATIDHAIEDSPGRVVAVRLRAQQLASEALGQVDQGIIPNEAGHSLHSSIAGPICTICVDASRSHAISCMTAHRPETRHLRATCRILLGPEQLARAPSRPDRGSRSSRWCSEPESERRTCRRIPLRSTSSPAFAASCSAPALIGDDVTVRTLVGREVSGVLTEVNPRNPADFGNPVPELLDLGSRARQALDELHALDALDERDAREPR